MSRTVRAGSYRAVLALPYAMPTFAAALVGRLAYGLLPLSLLFTVRHATGSFATAGAAVALFGVTSVLMPLKSRLVDRYGQPRVLLPLAGACAATLAAVAVLGASDAAPAAAYPVLGAAAGLAAPPLGPAMRSIWRTLTDDTTLKPRAYGLDSVCEESLYLLGPILVATILGVGPAAALGVTAALLVAGTIAMVSMPPGRTAGAAAASRAERMGPGPLRAPGFAATAFAVLAVAVGVSIAFTSIAARAQRHGVPEAAGYLEAAIAAGSVAGGLWWGRRAHRRSRSTHLAGLAAYLAVGIGAAGATDDLRVLGVVLAVTGAAIAPLFVVAYLASDDLAPPRRRTEASTWVNTANNVGSAAGVSVAGVVVERSGDAWGFAAASVALALTCVLVLLVRRRIDVPAGSSPQRTAPAGRAAQSRT